MSLGKRHKIELDIAVRNGLYSILLLIYIQVNEIHKPLIKRATRLVDCEESDDTEGSYAHLSAQLMQFICVPSFNSI